VKSDFVIWGSSTTVPYRVLLDTMEGFDEVFKLGKGVQQNGSFAAGVYYTMNKDRPHNTVFTDSLKNLDNLIVASRRLREFFQARPSKGVEYLPIGVMDHKGKMASREYAIIHPAPPVDCLDCDKSGVVFSRIVKTKIRGVQRLVLDPARMDPERDLFRLDRFFDVILIRRDAAEAIDREGFTGIRWIEPADFPED
jgi:hypothetical protein